MRRHLVILLYSILFGQVGCKEYPGEWNDRVSLPSEKIQELRLMKQLEDLRAQEEAIEEELHYLRGEI